MEELTATHTNSYSFVLNDGDGHMYVQAVSCLADTASFDIDGRPFTAWLTLVPPSETTKSSCSVPADSPLTPFNETALFNMSKGLRGCNDYVAWAKVAGKLSTQFSHFYEEILEH
jgi:hypothetical protein